MVARSGLVIALWLAATAVGAWGLTGIQQDNSVERLIGDSDPRLVRYETFRRLFGSDAFSAVAVEVPTIYDRAFLTAVVTLAKEITAVGGVGRVEHLWSKYERTGRTGRVEEVDPAAFRALVEPNPFNTRLGFTNAAGTLYTLYIPLIDDDPRRRDARVPAIDEVVARRKSDPGFAGATIRVVGQPQINAYMNRSATEVGMVFMPVFFVGSVLLIGLLFRSVAAVFAALIAVGVTEVVTLGLLAVTGGTMSLITTIIPVSMFVVNIAAAIHVLNGYFDPHKQGEGPAARIVHTLQLKWVAGLVTTVCSVVGFGSLAVSDVGPIREFGVFTSVGLIVGFLAVYSLLPALLAVMKPGVATFDKITETAIERFMIDFVARTAGWRVAATYITTAVLIASAVAVGFTRYESNPLNYLKPESPVRAGLEWFERNVQGLSTIELMLTSDEPGGFKTGPGLAALQALGGAIDGLPGVLGRTDITTIIAEAQGLAFGIYEAPEDDEGRVAWRDQAERADPDAVGRFASPDGTHARVRIAVATRTQSDFQDLHARMFKTAASLRVNDRPLPFAVAPTGLAELLASINLSLADTMLQSLVGSALLIAVLFYGMTWSLWHTFVVLLPNILPVTCALGGLYVLGLKLDIATVLTASIILGLAVNDTVHIVYHTAEARARGETLEQALTYVMRVAGSPLVIVDFVIAAGFAVFNLSDFPPIGRFGLLMCGAMIVAFYGDIVYLPALFRHWAPSMGLWAATPGPVSRWMYPQVHRR